jgi:hypothetical protein
MVMPVMPHDTIVRERRINHVNATRYNRAAAEG